MNIRLFATCMFVLDIAVLIVVLALLWTMEKRSHDCEMVCLPNTNEQSVCDCRAEGLQKYLRSKFIAEFTVKDDEIKGEGIMPYEPSVFDSIPSMKPNARVGGDVDKSQDDDKNSKDMLTLRSWRDSGNNMFLSNGVRYRNGRLVVPYKGIYQIYSFLDIRLDKYEDKIPHNKTFLRQAIFKSNIQNVGTISEEVELISSFRNYERTNAAMQDVYDTYLSADVDLDAGDEVYIKVCNKSYIRYPGSNFFGIRLL